MQHDASLHKSGPICLNFVAPFGIIPVICRRAGPQSGPDSPELRLGASFQKRGSYQPPLLGGNRSGSTPTTPTIQQCKKKSQSWHLGMVLRNRLLRSGSAQAKCHCKRGSAKPSPGGYFVVTYHRWRFPLTKLDENSSQTM